MDDPEKQKHLQETRQFWDKAAAQFDEAPDHGLRDPLVYKAWADLLKAALPASPGSILDIGCGTGSLSVVLSSLGYAVTGIDFSPEMISLAEAKAARAGYLIKFQVMDAAFPQLSNGQFDAIVCRHLLWALPERKQVLQRWADLLKPAGCLLLIEGNWHTGAGLQANEIIDAFPASLTNFAIQNLSDQPDLWDGPVKDERYAITAYRA